ncbi:MAG: hypothetical protein HY774_29910, partial [Acidobacteria bacterium]|nr:hypothetical protein [Acidobacteriota bacterium]
MAVHRFKSSWLVLVGVVCLGIYFHSQFWLSEQTVSATGVPAELVTVSPQTGSRLLSETHPVESFSVLQARLQSAGGVIVEPVMTGLERRLSGTPDHITIEWKVLPGVDPEQIELEFPGIDEVEQTVDGQLVLHQQPDTTLRIAGVKAWQEMLAQTIEIPVTVVYQGDGRIKLSPGTYTTSDALQISLQVVTRRGFAPNATLTVTSGADSGAGTLRDQIVAATAGDTIVFSGVSTVTLTTAELLINKDLTIDGGAGVTVTRSTAGGTPNFRIFNISSGVMMNNLSITNGNVSGGDGGGIINSGTLTMTGSTISGNTLTGSFPLGGGIFNMGALILTNCTISGNLNIGSTASLGGGIRSHGPVTLLNCTITGNTSLGGNPFGGGVSLGNGGTMNLRNSLIAGNSANQGIDIFGTIVSLGYNLIGNTANTTITGDTTGNILNVNPMLGGLASNGGPTQTHALLTGSPAIDAGTTTSAPLTDQRGFGRSGNTDIGAFEFNGLTPTTVTSMVRASGNPVCAGALVDWTVTFGASVTGVTSTNFAVVGGTGTSITNVTGSGTTWTVTVNTGTAGTASLGLNMVNSTGIARPISNLPFTGQTYTVDTPPTVNAGPDQMVCASSPTVTLAGVVGGTGSNGTWSGGGGTFTPNNTTLNATYTLSAGEVSAGMVTLTLTTNDPAGPCGSVSDTVTITIGSCLGLLVADTTNNRIQGFNGTDWSVIGVGTVGTGNGQFRLPEAAVVDGAGRIYVADTGNNRIQWSTDNGATWANFATNGTATNQVKAPQGLA